MGSALWGRFGTFIKFNNPIGNWQWGRCFVQMDQPTFGVLLVTDLELSGSLSLSCKEILNYTMV